MFYKTYQILIADCSSTVVRCITLVSGFFHRGIHDIPSRYLRWSHDLRMTALYQSDGGASSSSGADFKKKATVL